MYVAKTKASDQLPYSEPLYSHMLKAGFLMMLFIYSHLVGLINIYILND